MTERTGVRSGMDVVDGSGETVGVVEEVQREQPFVDFDPDAHEGILSKLGLQRPGDGGTVELTDDMIDRVTDGAVVLTEFGEAEAAEATDED
jgi:hypothetical protein